MTVYWIIGAVLVLQTLAIVALLLANLKLWLDREAARRALAVEHMAAQNLVEAVRREDWDAARTIVSAWSTS